jgi:sulfotransferase
MILFNSSLPRSGSTLLQNILGENPQFHVTPTNALLELIITIRDTWNSHIEFVAQDQKEIQNRIKNVLHSIMEGFYKKESKGPSFINHEYNLYFTP